MTIIKDLLPNLILMIFPMLVYFVYNCYRELKCEKYNGILFNLSLFSAVYLSLKYGTNISISLLVVNIPILIAYVKKESKVAVVLSLIIIIYTYLFLNKLPSIMIIKFITCYMIYLLCQKKHPKENKIVVLITVLQSFFIPLEYFFSYQTANIFTVLEILLFSMAFYTSTTILLHLFNLAENISSLYLTMSEVEKDKQLKNSLFKITHEVKNPIAVCKGYLNMLDLEDQDKVKRYIPIIQQEIDRSLNIMTDFMEFSKIKIEKDLLDINILLEDIIDEIQILLDNKNIKLSYKIIEDEIYINGDYNRLKQVFINFIKNSIEAIENNGSINIETHLLDKKYYIEITDNGCGMDEYTLSKVKELFFTTKKKGSGLGVSLSNEIIKSHDGTIDYTSKQNIGTKVIVKLPIIML